jgi:hypothetical protein
MNARVLRVDQSPLVTVPKLVSALNGRTGADIIVPPYQQLVETEYLPPTTVHWTQECFGADATEIVESAPESFEPGEILQPRRLNLRVF